MNLEGVRYAIMAFRISGKSIRETQRLLSTKFKTSVSVAAISNTIKKHVGYRNVVKKCGPTKKRSGRKTIVNKRVEKAMARYVRKHRGCRKITTQHLIETFDLSCSRQTVTNILERNNLWWLPRRRKSYPTKINRKQRLRFAKSMQSKVKDKAFMRRMIFIDGSTFYRPKSRNQMKELARDSCGTHVYRDQTEGLLPDTVGPLSYARTQGGSVKYWGVLGDGFFEMSPLPPKDLRTTKKPKIVNGQIKYRKTKNDNSVAMNKQRFADWIEKKLVPWLTTHGFPMKGTFQVFRNHQKPFIKQHNGALPPCAR